MHSETGTSTESNGNRLASSWLGRTDLRPIAQHVGTPVFIYSEEQLLRNVTRIKEAARSAGLDERIELYIPFFPNSNPHVLRSLPGAGVGLLRRGDAQVA